MSLVAFALRLVICRALTGKTYAGTRVLNAPVEPLDDVLADGAPAQPLIAVFTGSRTTHPTGRELARGAQELSLTIQIFAPPKVETADVDGVAFEMRGAGAAMLLDLTWRQITHALIVERNVWTRLFEDFIGHVVEIVASSVIFEIGEKTGVRIPCVEHNIDVTTVTEPMFGVPLAEHWLRLDAAMRAEPAMIPLADLLKAAIEQPSLPSWRQAQAALALSDAAIRASGLAPQDETETGEAAELADPDGIEIDPADLHTSTPFGSGL